MMWWLWFVVIQLINLPLMAAGWFICLWPAMAEYLELWWNDDDAKEILTWPWPRQYIWLAWRNPVANLRHVPGVSGPGRPMFYRTFTMFGTEHYIKIGWEVGPPYYPVFSAGSGRGY